MEPLHRFELVELLTPVQACRTLGVQVYVKRRSGSAIGAASGQRKLLTVQTQRREYT
jgi:hypothetical protein